MGWQKLVRCCSSLVFFYYFASISYGNVTYLRNNMPREIYLDLFLAFVLILSSREGERD